jgi:hypothetical protein
LAAHPAAAFAEMIRSDPERVAHALVGNIEALMSERLTAQLLPERGSEVASSFGSRKFFVFPIEDHQHRLIPALFAIDVPTAVRCGAAFSMMNSEGVDEILKSGKIPEVLHDAVGAVANIICGAIANLIRDQVAEASQIRCGLAFRQVSAGPWPAVLAEFGGRIPWDVVPCRLLAGSAERGAVLFGASDGQRGAIDAAEVFVVAGASLSEWAETVPLGDGMTWIAAGGGTLPADPPRRATRELTEIAPAWPTSGTIEDEKTGPVEAPDAIAVLVTGRVADASAAALRRVLEIAGARVLPLFPSPDETTWSPSALFVVIRSVADLSTQLENLPYGRRPALIVACSDRPTRELVIAARAEGADYFLVLPTTPELLRELLTHSLTGATG